MRTRAKEGCHVFIRPHGADAAAPIYGLLPTTVPMMVERIERNAYGRDVVYVRGHRADETVSFMFWRSQLRPVPRCDLCGKEGHTKSRATRKNCALLSTEPDA